MGQDNYTYDNSGNKACHPSIVDPVLASGITLATGTAGTDVTQTVVSGQMYAITLMGTIGSGAILASFTGVTSTAANIEHVFPAGVTCIFRVPIGKVTLYFEGTESTKAAYLRKVAG